MQWLPPLHLLALNLGQARAVLNKMKAAILFLLILASFSVPAETIYKSLDANGRVIYSDAPIHGARVVERFEGADETGPRGPAPTGDVARAERELERAERALQLGREPLPHERKG
ncbi:MAG: DUF4124 domain-containing protein, partial [Burkholderiales bacterium]